MENATKALIIAGTVLISILLISVGIMVFNSASDPINQSQNSSEAQAIQMFNESFNQYLGDNKTGQQAKSVISAVIASNGRNADHQVELTGIDKISGISTKKRYNITEEYGEDDDNKGYITEIKIEESK